MRLHWFSSDAQAAMLKDWCCVPRCLLHKAPQVHKDFGMEAHGGNCKSSKRRRENPKIEVDLCCVRGQHHNERDASRITFWFVILQSFFVNFHDIFMSNV